MYPKIMQMNKCALTWDDEVVIQEKIDGSFFSFWVEEDGLRFKSKRVNLKSDNAGMFALAVDYLLSLQDKIVSYFNKGTTFFCEFLSKEKHNVIKYDRLPKNHLVLFDMSRNSLFNSSYYTVTDSAKRLDIDVTPCVYTGKYDKQIVEELLKANSYLGGPLEGVVIKNYDRYIDYYGTMAPEMYKWVRSEFKEKLHKKEWAGGKDKFEEFCDSLRTEARWNKAVIHLKEEGVLTNELKDIGVLLPEVITDIEEEERDYIKDTLYSLFIKDIKRAAVRGFAEWYKNKKILERSVKF